MRENGWLNKAKTCLSKDASTQPDLVAERTRLEKETNNKDFDWKKRMRLQFLTTMHQLDVKLWDCMGKLSELLQRIRVGMPADAKTVEAYQLSSPSDPGLESRRITAEAAWNRLDQAVKDLKPMLETMRDLIHGVDPHTMRLLRQWRTETKGSNAVRTKLDPIMRMKQMVKDGNELLDEYTGLTRRNPFESKKKNSSWLWWARTT